MAQTYRVKRGTAAAWTAANPVLASGEPGYATDTGDFKVGNGTSTWSLLPTVSVAVAGPSGSDDTTALQAKLNAGSVRLQPGATYLVTALTVPAGKILDLNGSTIKKYSGTANLITPAAGAIVCNGTLDLNALAGAGVYVSAVADVTTRSITVINGAASNAFKVNAAATRPKFIDCNSVGCYNAYEISGSSIDGEITGGVHRNSVTATTFEGCVYITSGSRWKVTGVTVDTAAGHGFYDQGTDNTFVNCVARACGTSGNDHRGVTTDGSTRSTWIGCRFIANIECGFYDRSTSAQTVIQSCTSQGNNVGLRPGGHGFEVDGQGWVLDSCVSADQKGNATIMGGGFFFGGYGQATNCRAIGNWSHGFYIYDVSRCTVTGCTAMNNNVAAGAHDGFAVNASSPGFTGDVTINGCNAYDNQGTKKQRYGCSIAANVNFYVVTNNIFRAANNLTGGLIDSGGVNKVVTNNLT